MNPRLKICGITNLEDARFCAAAGVDYLGFVFHQKSPRCISTELAKDINEWIIGPQAVGVFVDEDVDVVNQVADSVGLDLVQLHGTESAQYCGLVEAPVIKALGIAPGTSQDDLVRAAEGYRDAADYLLLDSRVDGRSGGTGISFDWRLARPVCQDRPVFLAGGLRAGNVAR
ncbi:MAG: phosphoribosylanthranilate isomerase, partial [Rhodothermia bacterium]|nr:phosphoribosylanthranilate isomerase [Rhodothermia bacterium]